MRSSWDVVTVMSPRCAHAEHERHAAFFVRRRASSPVRWPQAVRRCAAVSRPVSASGRAMSRGSWSRSSAGVEQRALGQVGEHAPGQPVRRWRARLEDELGLDGVGGAVRGAPAPPPRRGRWPRRPGRRGPLDQWHLQGHPAGLGACSTICGSPGRPSLQRPRRPPPRGPGPARRAAGDHGRLAGPRPRPARAAARALSRLLTMDVRSRRHAGGSTVPSSHGSGRYAPVRHFGRRHSVQPHKSLWSHPPRPGGPMSLTLLSWRRTVHALYAEVRASPTPRPAHATCGQAGRDELLATPPRLPRDARGPGRLPRRTHRAVRPGVPLRGRSWTPTSSRTASRCRPRPTAWCRSSGSACCSCPTSATWTSGGSARTAAGSSSRSRTRSAGTARPTAGGAT